MTVNYSPDGSGAGREAFAGGGADFAGSDRAMKPEETRRRPRSPSSRCDAEPTAINLPVYISPDRRHLQGAGRHRDLKLDADTLAGIFAGIERLMTDNAWAYRWSLRDLCAAAGIKQVFIRPHCPWQNGKVERLNRTLLTEWAYRQVFLTNDDRSAALAPWLEHYNTRRRHSALGGLPPVSRLLPT